MLNNIAVLERIACDITAEQVGLCRKTYDRELKQSVYLVQSPHSPTVHEVTYDKNGFSCSCLCGRWNFANCPNFCVHVRIAVAAILEEINALAEIASKQGEDEEDRRMAVKPVVVQWNIPAWMLQKPEER